MSSEYEREAMTELLERHYRDWCRSEQLDPEDTHTMIAYEEHIQAHREDAGAVHECGREYDPWCDECREARSARSSDRQ